MLRVVCLPGGTLTDTEAVHECHPRGRLRSSVSTLSALTVFVNNLDDDVVGLPYTFANDLELVGKAMCWMAESESENISVGQI